MGLSLTMIRDHLQFLAECENGFGPANALLKYGRSFSAVRPQLDILPVGAPKECYRNAAHVVLHYDDVRYTEGYAVDVEGLPVPIEHAWLACNDGSSIDPTWRNGTSVAYYGIAFNSEFIKSRIARSRKWNGIFGDHDLMREFRRAPAMFEGVLDGKLMV